MKVDVKTSDGRDVTPEVATESVGSALRIADKFVATTTDDSLGVQTELTISYRRGVGRYVVTRVTHTAVGETIELNHQTTAKVGIQPIVQAAAPHCIFLTLDDERDPLAAWLSVAALSSAHGRILAPAVATEVVRRGSSEARMQAIEVLYGSAALAGLPPAKLIEKELQIPHRTASAWIIAARKAGRLDGMNYNAGRPAVG